MIVLGRVVSNSLGGGKDPRPTNLLATTCRGIPSVQPAPGNQSAWGRVLTSAVELLSNA